MTDDYAKFLIRKSGTVPSCGLTKIPPLHKKLKPFQKDILTWALRRGRSAIFQGTGTGKTFEQLEWARVVHETLDAPILIFAPLGVAFQTVQEADKWNIPGIAYAQDSAHIKTPITVTNYERRDNFNISSFGGIVLDESSIIKHAESKTRLELIEAVQSVLYRLCCTATPAPNDWTELGQHSEFLGVLTAKEMLAMFFVHEGAIRAGEVELEDWRLKRHATRAFWQWVSTWAVMLRDPKDFGYDEPDYVLPPLNIHQITVKADNATPLVGFFTLEARTLSERLQVRKNSVPERVAAAVALVKETPNVPWLIWGNLNAETDAIKAKLSMSVNVRGSDTPMIKEQNLLGFAQGKFSILISKPSIAGFGLNYQHCANMIFVGLNDSFEQLFQAIRRCWRFGQTKPVNVYLIASELEGAVVTNLQNKERKYEEMAGAMLEHMREFSSVALKAPSLSGRRTVDPQQNMELPTWL